MPTGVFRGENHEREERRGEERRGAAVEEPYALQNTHTPNTHSFSQPLALSLSRSCSSSPFLSRALSFSLSCACILAVSHTVHQDIRTSRVIKEQISSTYAGSSAGQPLYELYVTCKSRFLSHLFCFLVDFSSVVDTNEALSVGRVHRHFIFVVH